MNEIANKAVIREEIKYKKKYIAQMSLKQELIKNRTFYLTVTSVYSFIFNKTVLSKKSYLAKFI